MDIKYRYTIEIARYDPEYYSLVKREVTDRQLVMDALASVMWDYRGIFYPNSVNMEEVKTELLDGVEEKFRRRRQALDGSDFWLQVSCLPLDAVKATGKFKEIYAETRDKRDRLVDEAKNAMNSLIEKGVFLQGTPGEMTGDEMEEAIKKFKEAYNSENWPQYVKVLEDKKEIPQGDGIWDDNDRLIVTHKATNIKTSVRMDPSNLPGSVMFKKKMSVEDALNQFPLSEEELLRRTRIREEIKSGKNVGNIFNWPLTPEECFHGMKTDSRIDVLVKDYLTNRPLSMRDVFTMQNKEMELNRLAKAVLKLATRALAEGDNDVMDVLEMACVHHGGLRSTLAVARRSARKGRN
jgi:uncharacterized protein YuzB (UPF0349 family)